jgi:hypothetical protein
MITPIEVLTTKKEKNLGFIIPDIDLKIKTEELLKEEEEKNKKRIKIYKSTKYESTEDDSWSEDLQEEKEEKEEKLENTEDEDFKKHREYIYKLQEEFLKKKKDYEFKNNLKELKEWTFGNENFYEDCSKVQNKLLHSFTFFHNVKHLININSKSKELQLKIGNISKLIHKAYDDFDDILNFCCDKRIEQYGIVKETMEIPEE